MEEHETLIRGIVEKYREINWGDVSTTVAKTILGGIPLCSGFVTVWNEHEAIDMGRTLTRFIDAFVFYANQNEERFKRIEKDSKSANEIMNEFGKIIKLVKEEVSDIKVEMLSKFAVNIFFTEDSHNKKISLLSTFNELTDDDLKVLHSFRNKGSYKVRDFVKNESISYDDLVPALAKLESRGLIGMASSGGGWTQQYVVSIGADWKEFWSKKCFQITSFGLKLLNMISDAKK